MPLKVLLSGSGQLSGQTGTKHEDLEESSMSEGRELKGLAWSPGIRTWRSAATWGPAEEEVSSSSTTPRDPQTLPFRVHDHPGGQHLMLSSLDGSLQHNHHSRLERSVNSSSDLANPTLNKQQSLHLQNLSGNWGAAPEGQGWPSLHICSPRCALPPHPPSCCLFLISSLSLTSRTHTTRNGTYRA